MRITDRTKQILYGKSWVKGVLASDDFSLEFSDEKMAEGVDFVYVNDVTKRFSSRKMDGILGLAPSVYEEHLSSFV